MQKSGNPLEQLQSLSQKILITLCFACVLSGCTSLPLAPEKENQLNAEAAEICMKRRGSSQKIPERAFRTDGCTLWPDGNWQACCITHDMVYWCGGQGAFRAQADKELLACVRGTGHAFAGRLMWLGTRAAGSGILPTPWRWGYGWGWLRKMQHQDSGGDGN